LRDSYKAELFRQEFIVLNGNWNEQHTQAPESTVIAEHSSYMGLVQSSSLLLVLIAASAMLAGISYWYGISIFSVIVIFSVSLFAFLTLMAIWHKSAAKQADKVLKLLLRLLRR
jgi:hypothetical protein